LESIDGDTYQLAEPFACKFGYWLREYQFEIPAGMPTDIASVPWFLRFFLDRASLGTCAPVVHDYLCNQRGRVRSLQGDLLEIGWFDVSVLFLILMRLDGIKPSRAFLAFLAVLVGGPKWS
jgi:hypothetical protein